MVFLLSDNDIFKWQWNFSGDIDIPSMWQWHFSGDNDMGSSAEDGNGGDDGEGSEDDEAETIQHLDIIIVMMVIKSNT